MPLIIVAHGFAEARKQLSPTKFHEAVTELLREASAIASRVAHQGAPGHVKQSITVTVAEMSATTRSPLAEALPIEYGRHTTKFPPPDALLRWMAKHGISPRAVFPIARAIARRGIKGRFFMRAAAQAVEEAWPHLYETFRRKWLS